MTFLCWCVNYPELFDEVPHNTTQKKTFSEVVRASKNPTKYETNAKALDQKLEKQLQEHVALTEKRLLQEKEEKVIINKLQYFDVPVFTHRATSNSRTRLDASNQVPAAFI